MRPENWAIKKNEALDELKNYAIENFFCPTEKMALGGRKWPFLAKNIKFWPKMAIFSGPKIFKKNFFFVFFRKFFVLFIENEEILAPFGPFLATFGPLWPIVCTEPCPDSRASSAIFYL